MGKHHQLPQFYHVFSACTLSERRAFLPQHSGQEVPDVNVLVSGEVQSLFHNETTGESRAIGTILPLKRFCPVFGDEEWLEIR